MKEQNWEDRKNWFISQIGKRLFRTKNTCSCDTCKNIYEKGLIVSDQMHAYYLHSCESEMDIKYFLTMEEMREFESHLIK